MSELEEEDEIVEYERLKKKTSKHIRYESIATGVRIEDLPDTPILKQRPPQPSTGSSTSSKSKRPTLAQLDRDALAIFNIFKFHAVNHLSELDPWSSIADDRLEESWNNVIDNHDDPDAGLRISSHPANELFGVVKRLINSFISTNWTHGIKKAAVEALHAEFREHQLERKTECAEFVKAFQGPSDILSTTRPFLWGTNNDWNPLNGDAMPDKAGLFLGRVLIRTLASNYGSLGTSSNPAVPGLELSERPSGALMTSIIAVHRTLLCSVSGETHQEGLQSHFSRANFANVRDTVTGKIIPRATLFKKRIKKLPDAQWKKIIDEAQAYAAARKKKAAANRQYKGQVEGDEDSTSDGEEDGELHHPMFG